MHDPIAVGRRQALSAAVAQFAVAVLVALAFLLQGNAHAMSAAVGGFAMALGNALAASVSLGGIVTARVAFARLLLGTALKWAVVAGLVAMALASWHLPPLPLVVGLFVGLLVYQLLVGLRFSFSARTHTRVG